MKKKIILPAMFSMIIAFLLFGCVTAPVKDSLLEKDSGQIVFQSITIDDEAFFGGEGGGSSTNISGQLQIPAKQGKLPGVILSHGSNGVTDGERGWARELNRMGFAAFIVDSFTYRGISRTNTGRQTLGTGSSIIDAYRALELLRTHPRVDPSRIALMGFSRGGRVTLNASMTRFQKKWLSTEASFAGYMAFYPAIIVELIGQDDVSSQPIRIFQGAADDWTVAEKARAYVDQLRNKGRDVQMFEYPDAHHVFDIPGLSVRVFPDVLNMRECNFKEVTVGGEWIDPDTNEPWSLQASCFRRGATLGYNEKAYRQAIKDVEDFLNAIFLKP